MQFFLADLLLFYSSFICLLVFFFSVFVCMWRGRGFLLVCACICGACVSVCTCVCMLLCLCTMCMCVFCVDSKVQLTGEVREQLKKPTFDNWQWDDSEMLILLRQMFVDLGLVSKFNIQVRREGVRGGGRGWSGGGGGGEEAVGWVLGFCMGMYLVAIVKSSQLLFEKRTEHVLTLLHLLSLLTEREKGGEEGGLAWQMWQVYMQ